MLATIGATLYFLFALGFIGFGVHRFMQGEVTNGLLSFILSAVILNLSVRWIETFRD